MGQEIERKFLVEHDRWAALEKPEGEPIRQGYLLNDERCSMRVRIEGEKGYITIKGTGENARSHSEYEYEIPPQDGEELLKNFTAAGTEKTRYVIPNKDLSWEVDVFTGANEGLIVAEIELKNEDDEFEKPDWIGKEVTDDDRYRNSNLAEHPYQLWTEK